MKSKFLQTIMATIVCTGALATQSMAAVINLKADLKASSEVPATGSKGTGSLTAAYDETSKKLTWKGTYKDLTGPATAAHFHGPAEAGKNAGVAIPIMPTPVLSKVPLPLPTRRPPI